MHNPIVCSTKHSGKKKRSSSTSIYNYKVSIYNLFHFVERNPKKHYPLFLTGIARTEKLDIETTPWLDNWYSGQALKQCHNIHGIVNIVPSLLGLTATVRAKNELDWTLAQILDYLHRNWAKDVCQKTTQCAYTGWKEIVKTYNNYYENRISMHHQPKIIVGSSKFNW